MSEHRYDIRISESCVDPNRLMVERQDPDNFPRLQTRERCALEIAAYVFNNQIQYTMYISFEQMRNIYKAELSWCTLFNMFL